MKYSIDFLEKKIEDGSKGSVIKYYRTKKGYSLEKLSEIIDLDVNTICNYENNKMPYSLSSCNKIADALGFRPEMIYDEYLLFVSSAYDDVFTQIRLSAGLNKKEFAKFIGVTPCTIGSWEAKLSAPTREMYIKIKPYLHTL